jgi:hypothetical protein
MKQTAVEWLYEQIDNKDMGEIPMWVYNFIEQAKEMEREQIIEACNSQKNDYRGMPTYNKSGEQYYNETYGGKK